MLLVFPKEAKRQSSIRRQGLEKIILTLIILTKLFSPSAFIRVIAISLRFIAVTIAPASAFGGRGSNSFEIPCSTFDIRYSLLPFTKKRFQLALIVSGLRLFLY